MAPPILQTLNEHPKFNQFYDQVVEHYLAQYSELGNVAVLRATAGVYHSQSFG